MTKQLPFAPAPRTEESPCGCQVTFTTDNRPFAFSQCRDHGGMSIRSRVVPLNKREVTVLVPAKAWLHDEEDGTTVCDHAQFPDLDTLLELAKAEEKRR